MPAIEWQETKPGQEWFAVLEDPEWGHIWRREVRRRDTRFSRVPLPDDDELVRVEFCWTFTNGASEGSFEYAVPGRAVSEGACRSLAGAKGAFARAYAHGSLHGEAVS